jgi:phage tail sheath protein FI
VGRPDDREKRGLATLSEKDEVSILAIPDLTASSGQPEEPVRAYRPRINQCSLSTPVQRRSIAGRVFDAATVSPNNLPGLKALAGVEIQLDDGLTEHEPQKTDKGGHFEFPNLLPGQVELLVTLGGYKVRIVRISVKPGIGIQELADIVLTPIEQPSALSEADIFYAQAAMIQQCELLRDRVAILDPPWPSVNEPEDINRLQAWRSRFETAFAALYYPWLVIRDPLQPTVTPGKLMPASGHIAGIYAATDLAEGVFRPPANKMLRFVEDVGTKVDDALQGVLNPKGINVIRAFPGRGIRVFGARTLSSNTAWRFVNVRRLMNFLEEAIDDGLQWAVFEPNNEQLWFGIRLFLTTFLDNLWRQGALVGDTTEAAYQVRCDAVTTTPDAQAAGQVIAEVSVAPTIPYEFIVFRLGLTMDELKISEVSP